MHYWLRVHRMAWLALVAVAVPILSSAFSDAGIFIPSFSGGQPFAMVPLVTLSGAALPVLHGWLFYAASVPPTAASSRPIAVLDASAAVAICGVSAVTAAALGALFWDQWAVFIRSALGLMGISLLILPLAGHRFMPMVPVLFLFGGAVFGRGPRGGTLPWSWVIDPEFQPWHLVVSGAVLALGSAAALVPRSRR